jgi:hypothetical protein
MPIDFPNSPNNGDSFTSNDKTWQYNGTSWVVIAGSVSIDAGSVTASKLANNAVTADKIAAGAVTAAKLGNDISLTPADGSITQAKLAASLSVVTVTTTANRGAAVPSPFTGQTIYLSDVKRVQIWDGSAWMFVTNGAPGAPTALSATPLSTTSVSVAFTTGTINGAAVTNYKYAYSSDGGSTYSEFAAFDPVDTTSPVVISGLTGSTAYLIKLRAVSDFGDSSDSSAVAVTTLTAPSAPTSLSSTGFYLMARIAFTAGADGGSPITNYEYALSTNGGATYGAFTALSPADTTSPIDIPNLINNTTYSIKIRAINVNGTGIESSAVSVTTNQNFQPDYLVVAGGGGGGGSGGNDTSSGGGGGGGLRSTVTASGGSPGTVETPLTVTRSTNYAVAIGGGGTPGPNRDIAGSQGTSSSFSSITTVGGGGGASYSASPTNGGSGGGAVGQAAGTGTANQGFAGGTGVANTSAGGGGGAGAVGNNRSGTTGGAGGAGVMTSITGGSVTYAGGGGGGGPTGGAGGSGGGGAGVGDLGTGVSGNSNSGGGGGGTYVVTYNNPRSGGVGGSGVVILRYPSYLTITLGAGLTGSTTTVGSNKVTTITAGSGNVSWA